MLRAYRRWRAFRTSSPGLRLFIPLLVKARLEHRRDGRVGAAVPIFTVPFDVHDVDDLVAIVVNAERPLPIAVARSEKMTEAFERWHRAIIERDLLFAIDIVEP